MNCKKLVLGTAQLGEDYGIAYRSRKILPKDFQLIMNLAQDAGVYSIDTAMTYGDSQKVLGMLGVNDWSITTKLPSIPENIKSIDEWYFNAIKTSLEELKVKKINTLLIHNVKELSARYGSKLVSLLQNSKNEGYVKNIGVSIYSPKELDDFYNDFQPDIVQCPYNIFDQRIHSSGWLQKLTTDNVEVHARSIFLQGVILRDVSELNSYFNPWLVDFKKWEEYCKNHNISKLQASIDFVKAEDRIKKIIIGIENINQLEQILNAYLSNTQEIFNSPCEDKDLLNPLMWKII